jgi:hypothetical protein
MAPKSTGSWSSRLRITTWKMLRKSCRSPIERVI